MWKRFSRSLTLRIFLITAALLLAACGVTYAAIAYLTPISYTSLLEDELRRASEALIETLAEGTAEDSEAVLRGFARETGADMRLVDARGEVLYDTLSEAANAVAFVEMTCEMDASEGTAMRTYTVSQADAVVEEALSAGAAEALDVPELVAGEDAGIGTIDQVTVVEEATDAPSETIYTFNFSDGTGAMLTVQGGMRAVNQATEAMARLLPYLVMILLAFSMLGSFFYARFITRPIVEISGIAGKIAALDFRARWTKRREDEIGALGESLNRLSDNLSGAMTELRAANSALKRDIDRERELDRRRLAFFSAASHELKTPVTILKGQISGMLAQVGVYCDREKYLARALEVTGRMESLIREILTISRIESGGLTADVAPVDLSALMQRQLELDGELMEQRKLHLRMDIVPGVMLRGSESLLANALDNVLMNAILYSPQGAEVRVKLDRQGFEVENSGVSIAPEALGQLFEPFYRVEQSRNRRSGGSGLGLYLVKCILRLYGVDCAIDNTSTGVCFRAHFGGRNPEA